MEHNGGYRLPAYKGNTTNRGTASQSLQVTPTQMTLQKQARMRQNQNGKSPNELSITLEKLEETKPPNEEEPHLAVYDKIPKGMNPKEYKQWAQQWLPRLPSGRGKKKPKGFALHIPSRITIRGEEPINSTDLTGPLVLHFNHGKPREDKAEYLDMYKTYKTKRVQSAKLPKTKRHSGSPRKSQSNDAKWDFLRPEEEPKTVKGIKLEIPAWQTSRNTPDTNELNHFLDSMKERTYMSFCQRSSEAETETSPRMIKSKSAGVNLERFSAKRNKLGILEPPHKIPPKKGNLRQGHSFEISSQKLNEFVLSPSPDLGEAIVPIKKTNDKPTESIFLTEGKDDEDVGKRNTKVHQRPPPAPPYITRIPSNLAKEEPEENEEDTTLDSVSNFVISGSKFGKRNESGDDELPKDTDSHCNDLNKANTNKIDPIPHPACEEPKEPSRPVQSGHIDVTLPDSAHSRTRSQDASPEDADIRSQDSDEDACDSEVNRVTKSRKVVIKFSKDNRNKIESIRTVTTERLVLRD